MRRGTLLAAIEAAEGNGMGADCITQGCHGTAEKEGGVCWRCAGGRPGPRALPPSGRPAVIRPELTPAQLNWREEIQRRPAPARRRPSNSAPAVEPEPRKEKPMPNNVGSGRRPPLPPCRVTGCARLQQPNDDRGLCHICADRLRRATERGLQLTLEAFIAMPAPAAQGPRARRGRTPKPPDPPAARDPKSPAALENRLDRLQDARMAEYIVTHTNWHAVAPAVQLKVALVLMEAAHDAGAPQ